MKIPCTVHSKACDCSIEYRINNFVMQLPSYGLIGGKKDDPMISRKAVLTILGFK